MSVFRPTQIVVRSLRTLVFILIAIGPVAARADIINIGYFSLDTIVSSSSSNPGTIGFDIFDLTGNPAMGGSALPADFPVYSPLLLQSVQLRYVIAGVANSISLPDVGPSGYSPAAAQQFVSTTLFDSATFTANLSSSTFVLSDGTTWQAPSTALSAVLLPSSGTALAADVDLAVLSVNANRADATPEPAALLLLVSGGIGLLSVQRLRAGKK